MKRFSAKMSEVELESAATRMSNYAKMLNFKPTKTTSRQEDSEESKNKGSGLVSEIWRAFETRFDQPTASVVQQTPVAASPSSSVKPMIK